jgi:hypothetical protein
MKTEMTRSKSGNPLNVNPGMGNSVPSPAGEPLKGGVHHAGTPETTTRSSESASGQGPDHIKGEGKDSMGERLAS